MREIIGSETASDVPATPGSRVMAKGAGAKGTCVISYRGGSIELKAWAGVRIVSIKIDVPQSDKDPIATAKSKLGELLKRPSAPPADRSPLLACWYEPSDSTVRMRVRIPHDRYVTWRNATYETISPTRALQKIDDRLEIFMSGGSRWLKDGAVGARGDVSPFDAAGSAMTTVPSEGQLDGLPTANGDPAAIAVTSAVTRAARAMPRPDYRRQAVITMMAIAASWAFMSLGGIFMGLAGVPIGFLIVHSCFFYDAVRKRARGVDAIAAAPAAHASALPRRSEEWDLVRSAIAQHAGDRAEDVARAEMRIRGLLESNAPSLNPIVIESTARIGNGLRDLVAAHRAPASMATPEEAAALAERLADSICALGVEAEDARVVAFRDAVFDFDATTRYIESRNDPILRIVDGQAKSEA